MFEFLKIGLGLLEVCLKACLLFRIARLLYIVLQLLNVLGHSRKLFFDVRQATYTSIGFGQVVLGALGGNDFQIGGYGSIGLIALPVIPMIMRIDDLTNRLL